MRNVWSVLRLTHRDLIALAVAAAIAGLGTWNYLTTISERHHAEVTARRSAQLLEARSTLQNCIEIEKIKALDRKTIAGSLVRLPSAAYFHDHPDELAQAIEDTKRSLEERAPRDCYSLPVVRAAGLHR